jgi:hypothetical protein
MLEGRQVDAEGRRPHAGAMMEPVGLRDDAEDGHPPDESRDREAAVGDAIVREDVCGDVKRAAEANASEYPAAEYHERRRYEERPDPERIIPDDASSGRMRMVRFVLTPERPVKDEAVDDGHQRLGQHDGQGDYGGEHHH